MLLATGLVALGQKVADEKKKRKDAKQGQLRIGDSNVAKSAFAGGSGTERSGTEIKFEDPADVSVTSPDTDSPTIYTPRVEIQDVRHTSQSQIASPVQSEKALLGPASPGAETPMTPTGSDAQRSRSSTLTSLPPYSPAGESGTGLLKPTATRDSQIVRQRPRDSLDSRSISTRSTNSRGTHAIRVKTRGADLKSGFPYHPSLFDLRVHPEKWESFTNDIVSATKSSPGDYAKVWGAATGIALTGAWATSIFVGRTVNRQLKEQKIKRGLEDNSAGSLGDKLKLWNEEYFGKQGLCAHLELSESAMKNDGKSTPWRKPTAFYSTDADKERKRDERKFVIVITKLDEDGQPTEALHELGVEEPPVEIGSSNGAVSQATELPAEVFHPVELPAEAVVELPAETVKKDEQKDFAYAEMDSDNSHLLEKLQVQGHDMPIATGTRLDAHYLEATEGGRQADERLELNPPPLFWDPSAERTREETRHNTDAQMLHQEDKKQPP